MSNVNCPQCGAPVDQTASFCKYCGEQFAQQPTQQVQQVQQPVYQQPPIQQQYHSTAIDPRWPIKNKIVAGLLGIFLGGFGIHKFYMGKIGMGIVYLIFFWTYIPAIIGFIEGIIYLCSNDHNFQVKHKVRLQ